MTTHHGGCHCGRVRFAVEGPARLRASECNCSICGMLGYLHFIVPRRDFSLLSGEDALGCYRFNTGTAQHTFCRHCGVKPFYVPRSHPQGISVNARCIDPATVEALEIMPFDGRNWERHVADLPPLGE